MPVCRSGRQTHRRPSDAAGAAATSPSRCPRRWLPNAASTGVRCVGAGNSTGARTSTRRSASRSSSPARRSAPIFYWFGRDLIAYSILAAAALIDLIVYGRLKDITVCYRCHTEFRGACARPPPPSIFTPRTCSSRNTSDGLDGVDNLADRRSGRSSIHPSIFPIDRRVVDRRLKISEERHLHHRFPPRPCFDRREFRCTRRPATGS